MIIIALGANLPSRYGDAPRTLKEAHKALADESITIIQSSSLWRTAPVPASDQPWFYNQVVQIKTEQKPHRLLETLHKIEASLGRVRSVKNAARIIDLDLVAYDDLIINDRAGLVLPHPRMAERLFVLGPLQEIAPAWRHPISGRSVEQMLSTLGVDQKGESIVP